ncbi:Maf-like protein [Flavicella sediminum]|uniref:Maf-like protein n=1 Tax=Flavicella sediminum TaxID=2585141 RepID=UPI001121544D|nr:Maf-like protein [Flavicella sediminum]
MLSNLTDTYQIILASGSPRRQQFLKDLGLPFRIQLFDVEEIYPEDLFKNEITEYLSELKSKPFDETLKDNELVITSDTIVWFDNKALEKPKNEQEAFQMLKALSGQMHEVITSVCIKTKQHTETITDTTKVYFSEVSDEEIQYYISNFKPFDKAGSYGIQEWIGFIAVEKIEGSYFNVMGLPIHKLYKYLKTLA